MKQDKWFRRIIVLLIGILFGTGCDQEPLFWDIAHEYPPISSVVGGHATQIVAIGNNPDTLYTSNGNIWKYEPSPGQWNGTQPPLWQWMDSQPPGGKIKEVTATNDTLFALNWEGQIWKGNGTTWDPVPVSAAISGKVEHIFGANTYLFTGVLDPGGIPGMPTSYSIWSTGNNGSSWTPIKEKTSLLMGAAYDDTYYYFGTLGDGVYIDTNPSIRHGLDGKKNTSFRNTVTGLMTYKIGADKYFFIVTDTMVQCGKAAAFMWEDGEYHFTGAIAGWTQGTNHLILLGLQHSSGSFGYGYREVWILDDGTKSSGLKIPGEHGTWPSSVEYGSQFISAIGKHGINYFHVSPTAPSKDNQNRPLIFATTIKDGIWSYRTRAGKAQWNGEDNSDY